MNSKNSKKVFVGLSGGVDSAVVAYLLKEQGYDVHARFMKNWSGEDFGIADQCPWEEDLASAREVAAFLDIPLEVYNFEKEYRELVVEDFFKQYEIGNTPNPDILCNTFIKFDVFLKRCLADGADFIATGHYAKSTGQKLMLPKDRNKDQTYFLSGVSGEHIAKSIFPLGDLEKPEVRKIAEEANLPNAKRKDSQGICFIGHIDLREFLSTQLKKKNGEIVDIDTNKVVGTHEGVWFYTVGQRKGIGIGGKKEPYFVASKDVEKNILYVAEGQQNKALWSDVVRFKELHIIDETGFKGLESYSELEAIIRYRAKHCKVPVKMSGDHSGETKFEAVQWTPTPGQSIVFYSDGECLGRAEIVN